MYWLAIFHQAMHDCKDEYTRCMHQRGLLNFIQGWSNSVHLTNERGIGAEFEIAVKAYMKIFLTNVHDAHDAEVK